MSIYIERLVRAPLDDLWNHTQDPTLHQRWDLRFTEISYLPRPDPTQPQRFRYATRVGFGIAVRGEGESIGERDLADGSRSSALRFWSDQARSLIGEGRGYWKYVPTPDGVRFITSYDYSARYGRFGRFFDRIAFRPLIGWATAWSFDRLGLWLEGGIDPASSMRQATSHALARLSLAAIFVYHGIVPKLLGPHPDEIAMLTNTGVPGSMATIGLIAFGVVELLFAIALLAFWHRAAPALVCLGFALVSTIGVSITSPDFIAAPFNPVTLNLAVGSLALIDVATLRGLPDASRCRRRPEVAQV